MSDTPATTTTANVTQEADMKSYRVMIKVTEYRNVYVEAASAEDAKACVEAVWSGDDYTFEHEVADGEFVSADDEEVVSVEDWS